MNKLRIYILSEKHPKYPELPIGFEIAWNVVENGFTGKISHWFPITENPKYWKDVGANNDNFNI